MAVQIPGQNDGSVSPVAKTILHDLGQLGKTETIVSLALEMKIIDYKADISQHQFRS